MTSTTDARLTAVADRAHELASQACVDGGVGIGIGIVCGGEVVTSSGFGYADVARREPVTDATSFRIGSVTKTFTALAVLNLVETGAIRLDDPVSAHLRSIRIRAARGSRAITVRDMLTHTSGLGELRGRRELVARRIPFVVDDGARVPPLAEFYRRGLRADTPAGRRWSYSNHAFAALGQLVEDVTGIAYGDYVDSVVIAPLGMTATTLAPDRETLATGYTDSKNGVQPVPYQQIVIAPAGAYHSTLSDMLRFADWLASGGRSASGAVTPATLDDAFARHHERDLRLPGFGLGFSRDDVAGQRVISHDGGFPGFLNTIAVLPDAGLGIVVWGNIISGAPLRIAGDLVRLFLGVESDEATTTPDLPFDGATIDRICGRYRPLPGWNSNLRWRNEYGRWVDIRSHDGRPSLWSKRGPFAEGVPLQLASVDDELFWVGTARRLGSPVPIRLRFETDGTGRVRGFQGAAHTHVAMSR